MRINLIFSIVAQTITKEMPNSSFVILDKCGEFAEIGNRKNASAHVVSMFLMVSEKITFHDGFCDFDGYFDDPALNEKIIVVTILRGDSTSFHRNSYTTCTN